MTNGRKKAQERVKNVHRKQPLIQVSSGVFTRMFAIAYPFRDTSKPDNPRES